METEEKIIQKIKKDPFYIQYIENPTEETQLESVKQNGSDIVFIKNPTEKVIRTAILNGAKKEYLKHVDISELSDETKLMTELL